MSDDTSRLDALEIRVAHQDLTIEDARRHGDRAMA